MRAAVLLAILTAGCDATAEAGVQTTLAFAVILLPIFRLLALREGD